MRGYKPADWGEIISDVQNANGNALYKPVELKWSTPTIWRKGDHRPKFDDSTPFVYALVRNHGKSATKDHILYIGLTQKPKFSLLEITRRRKRLLPCQEKLSSAFAQNRLCSRP